MPWTGNPAWRATYEAMIADYLSSPTPAVLIVTKLSQNILQIVTNQWYGS